MQRDRSRPRGDWPCNYSTSGKGNSSQTGRGMSPTSKRKMFFVTWLISVLWCVKETVGGWIRREGAGVAEPSQRMRPRGTRGICFFSALCFRLTSLQLTSWGETGKPLKSKFFSRETKEARAARVSSGYLPSLNCGCSTFCWDNDQDLMKVSGVLLFSPLYLQGITKSQLSREVPCRGQGLSLSSCSFCAYFFVVEGSGKEVVFYLPTYR